MATRRRDRSDGWPGITSGMEVVLFGILGVQAATLLIVLALVWTR